jgi:hypothetical protein
LTIASKSSIHSTLQRSSQRRLHLTDRPTPQRCEPVSFTGGARALTARMVQVKDLPHQDNYHDCGLFVLVYMEFFSFNTPLHIHHITGRAGKPFDYLLKHFGEETGEGHPSFLTHRWFSPLNPYYLRFTLMISLLERMRKATLGEARGAGLEKEIAHSFEFEESYKVKLSSTYTSTSLASVRRQPGTVSCLCSVHACACCWAVGETVALLCACHESPTCRYATPEEVKDNPELQGNSRGIGSSRVRPALLPCTAAISHVVCGEHQCRDARHACALLAA